MHASRSGGYPLANIISILSTRTHRWTTWNPPKIRSAARATFCLSLPHTHTPRLQYEVVSRIVSRWRMRRGGRREGAREKSVCSVHDMFYHPGVTRRNNDPRLSRAIVRFQLCHTKLARFLHDERGFIYRKDDSQKSPPTLAGRQSRTYYSPPTTCRRSPIVPRRAKYRLSRARSIDRR